MGQSLTQKGLNNLTNYWVFRVYPNRVIPDAVLHANFSAQRIGTNFASFEEVLRHLIVDRGFPALSHVTPPVWSAGNDDSPSKNAMMDRFGWYVLCSDEQDRWYHFVIIDHDLEQQHGLTHPLIALYQQEKEKAE